jgi:large subunit ribosomal protein L25
MDQVTLRAETGRETGSRPSRRLRRVGQVPAVVYGRGLEPVSVSVDRRELYGALHTEAGANALINLEVGKKSYLTVAREVQRHPVRGEIEHLDFLQISLDEAIEAEVGIEFVGEVEGTKEGGIVEFVQTSVIVEALPTEIPRNITLDISALGIGDSASVSDLPELEGVTYVSDPDMALVTVVVPAALVVEEEVEEELLEGEEAVEAEAAEGEAAEAPTEEEDEG